MVKLLVTWKDDTMTFITVSVFDDYWVKETGELRVWFPDNPSVMEVMSLVKSVKVIPGI